MKNNLIVVLLIVLTAVCSCLTAVSMIRSVRLRRAISSDIEALAYSNEGPGSNGSRHKQSVWCSGGGWIIRVGCCYGAEFCTYIECGVEHGSFSCDGNHWIHY